MQNINLLPEEYRPQQVVLSAQQILQYNILFLLIFALIFGANIWGLETLKSEERKLSFQLEQAEFKLQEFKKNHQKPTMDTALESIVASLQEKLKSKQDLLIRLNGLILDKKQGFSDYLVGLSNGYVAGLWLMQIKILEDGAQLRLMGKTINPELVPQYLENLKEEPVFIGKIFDTVKMQRPDKASAEIEFSLQFGAKAQEEKE